MTNLNLFSKKNLITLFLTITFSLVIIFLIYNRFIYPAITPMIKDGLLYLFADWSVIVNANLCAQQGLDVFIENPCDPWNRKHVYGEILLYLPFVNFLKKFYLIYFPLITNFLFIYITISFFYYKQSLKNYTLVFFILSAPFLIAVERTNIDILLFLIIYLISKNKNILVNHFFILLGVLSKFFPLCFGVIFFFKKYLRKILFNLIILCLITSVFLFFQIENILKIFSAQSQFSGGNVYAFSFKSLINTINYFQIVNDSFFWIKPFFIVGFLLIPLFLIMFFFIKVKKNKEFFLEIFNNDIFENRIYVISSITFLSCYFIIENIFYREIFFLGLIPWLLKNEDQQRNIKDFYYYFLLFKFIMTTILIYLVLAQNTLFFNFKPLLILFKHTIDFYLITIIFFTFSICFFNFIKKGLALR